MALHPELSIKHSMRVIWGKMKESWKTGKSVTITYQDLCMHPGGLWDLDGYLICPHCKKVLGRHL